MFFNYVENVNKMCGHNKMFCHRRSRLTSNKENFSKTSLTHKVEKLLVRFKKILMTFKYLQHSHLLDEVEVPRNIVNSVVKYLYSSQNYLKNEIILGRFLRCFSTLRSINNKRERTHRSNVEKLKENYNSEACWSSTGE